MLCQEMGVPWIKTLFCPVIEFQLRQVEPRREQVWVEAVV